ncbi:GHKL domain-containing protein [Adlercreutzia equolifaciens]|uniref:GHKL domain-containing protein n=1 Tax=Adlercreutzia equolifaciens TaxID=446660 RepID=A0A6L8Q402_9ACTN|nr:GHKL domain-containing protein [Adlercreutzia equolifaciens]MZG28022.1 GHKL domain-containing protein [Adlercreutzia equolifaciens]
MSHSILHRISFLLYPASQLVMVAVSAVWIVRLQLPEVYLRVVGLLALACIPVDFQLFREVRKTQEADILRERVRMLEEQERVQVAYREQIAADMEDIMKLRREVAEEMDEAVRRLREQEEGSAQERLSRAVDIMGSTAFRLCEYRSADAVATMKLKACEEAGVRPRFSLEIPHNVGVPAVELCAVIANLADNGLAAALRAWDAGGPGASSELGASSASSASSEPGASGEPFLSLRSSVRQGHLVIEAKNSISEADRVAWEESAKRSRKRQRTWDEAHGWGLSIISGIAQRHGGSLECAIEDGVFRATVIMRLGSASDAAARGEAERTLPDRAACADDLELAGGVL